MASSGNNDGSWWNSLVQTAKQKSLNAFELIKNDLNEFTTTMKNDISEVSTQLQDSSLIDHVKTLTPLSASSSKQNNSIDKLNNKIEKKSNVATGSNKNSPPFDRLKTELLDLQNDQQTYINDPLNSKDYLEWRDSYDPDSNKGIISDLLIENSTMRSLYSQLVPAVISNKDFWSRYFFKAKLIEEEHKTRTNLIEKATSQASGNEVGLAWDEDGEEDWSKVDNLKASAALEKNKEGSENLEDDSKQVQVEEKPDIENAITSKISDESNVGSNTEERKNIEDSDEWEKDFEIANTEKASLTNVAEIVKERLASEKTNDEITNNKDEKEGNKDEEKSDEWESWD